MRPPVDDAGDDLERQNAPLAHLSRRRETLQWWEGWGGPFSQPRPSQLRKLNVAGKRRLRARNEAKRACVEDTLYLLAVHSPPITTSTRHSAHDANTQTPYPPRPRNPASNGTRCPENVNTMGGRGGLAGRRTSPFGVPDPVRNPDAGGSQHCVFVAACLENCCPCGDNDDGSRRVFRSATDFAFFVLFVRAGVGKGERQCSRRRAEKRA